MNEDVDDGVHLSSNGDMIKETPCQQKTKKNRSAKQPHTGKEIDEEEEEVGWEDVKYNGRWQGSY